MNLNPISMLSCKILSLSGDVPLEVAPFFWESPTYFKVSSHLVLLNTSKWFWDKNRARFFSVHLGDILENWCLLTVIFSSVPKMAKIPFLLCQLATLTCSTPSPSIISVILTPLPFLPLAFTDIRRTQNKRGLLRKLFKSDYYFIILLKEWDFTP